MIVYTDGAYSSSTDCGGIGIVFVDKGEYCKKYTHTTNQRMEVKAAIIALQSIKEPTEVTIISDSAYLVKTMNNEFKRKANLFTALASIHNIHVLHDVCAKMRALVINS